MRQVIVCVALSAVVAVFAAVPTSAFAQKEKEKAKDKGKAAGPVIEINESDKDGKFRFVIRNAAGKAVALSPVSGFATEKDAETAIADLKTILSGSYKTVRNVKKDKK